MMALEWLRRESNSCWSLGNTRLSTTSENCVVFNCVVFNFVFGGCTPLPPSSSVSVPGTSA